MSITTVPSYPFDPTGAKASNKIAGEQHILTGANPRDNYFIVPNVPPFFEEGLTVSFKDSTTGQVRTLYKNVDFYCSHRFLDASYSTAKPIYGSITFLNTALVGVVTLGYQSVGGEWVPSNARIAEMMADRMNNPRTRSWEQVINPPNAFPVIAHEYDLVTMKGLDEMVTAINTLTAAIISRSGVDLAAHKGDFSNPHKVTADQLDVFTKAQTVAKINELVTAAIAAHVAARHT